MCTLQVFPQDQNRADARVNWDDSASFFDEERSRGVILHKSNTEAHTHASVKTEQNNLGFLQNKKDICDAPRSFLVPTSLATTSATNIRQAQRDATTPLRHHHAQARYT
jgi:hypothetical protein